MTLELSEVRPGQKLLDVGCGTGSLAIVAKAKAGPDGEVHGIDAAPGMIKVALRKADNAGTDVRFQVGLIEGIPFPDDQFDLALSTFMLHHLPDDLKRKGFAEIYRVLKPGGHFLTVDFGAPKQFADQSPDDVAFRALEDTEQCTGAHDDDGRYWFQRS